MRILIFVITLIVIGVLFAIWYLQEESLFPSSVLPTKYRFKPGPFPFDERRVAAGGSKVHSLYLKPPEARNLILYFHGNAGALDYWRPIAEALALKTKSEVWVMDYPGYGLSTNRIRSEQQLLSIADEFYARAVTEAKSSKLRLFIWGRSIGSGIAAQLVAKNPSVAGLILETPYFGLERVVKDTAWWAPLWLLRYRLQTFAVMPLMKCPVLILHGDADTVIKVQHARDLAALNPEKIQLLVIPGGHHSDLATYSQFWSTVEEFTS